MKNIKLLIVVLIIIGLASLFVFKGKQTTEIGFLEGKVSVGPICPVERPGIPCDVPPEVYTSREIIVYNTNGKIVVAKTNPKEDGNYYFELPAGDYIVDIARSGIDFSRDVPKQASIKAGETIKLDINIDTGIR